MGNKSVKQKNNLLTEQAKRSQNIQDELIGFGQQDRNYNTGTRDFVTDQYKRLLSGYDEDSGGGGGGGGGGFSPTPYSGVQLNYADPRMNESMEGYREFAKTGGFNPEQMADYRARGTATIPSFFEGLKTQLSAANRASGGNVGFNSQMAKLARESAYGAQRAAIDTEAGLQDQIRGNRFRGLEGVTRNDTEFMDRGTSVEDKRNQEILRRDAENKAEIARQDAARASAAAGSRRASEDAFREKMAILDSMRELRGESGSDLPYYQAGGAFGGQATQNLGARETEPGFWDRATGLIGNAANAAVGAFTGLPRRKSKGDDYSEQF